MADDNDNKNEKCSVCGKLGCWHLKFAEETERDHVERARCPVADDGVHQPDRDTVGSDFEADEEGAVLVSVCCALCGVRGDGVVYSANISWDPHEENEDEPDEDGGSDS